MSKVLFAIVMCVLTAQGGDWLLDPSSYRADVREDGGAWMQENGLARRVIATKPGVATVSLKCLTTDEELVRGGCRGSPRMEISASTSGRQADIARTRLWN